MSLGLYVHVPFCAAICNYCNFNRGLYDPDLKARYVDALVAEIRAADPGEADTIYFGGGTPSLLAPDDVARVVAAAERTFVMAGDREVTLEANPDSVDAARLAAFWSAGVNRVSFGVQSLRDDELRRLSRLHSAAGARTAVGAAREAGFDNVSVDLMMWLPGQRVDEWLESVDGAIALGPDHVSLYLLEVYPNAPLRDEMARSGSSQAPDDDAAIMYTAAMERVEAAGLPQYEISNAAKPGRRSRHNLKYWTDEEWVGFGCGAHSTRGGRRWRNVAGTEAYVVSIARGRGPAPAAVELRELTAGERLSDALIMGLRLADGVDLAALSSRYGVDLWRCYGRELEPFVDAGLAIRDGDRLRLTRAGMLVASEIMVVFV